MAKKVKEVAGEQTGQPMLQETENLPRIVTEVRRLTDLEEDLRLNIELVAPDMEPIYGSKLASGMDLKARINELGIQRLDTDGIEIVPGFAIYASKQVFLRDGVLSIYPGHRALIPLGIKSSFPEGYEMQIRPRSGLAIRKGLSMINSPGTIDADYRDEWCAIVINSGINPIHITHGDRIAQAVIQRSVRLAVTVVKTIDLDVDRGGGFGSTGTLATDKK